MNADRIRESLARSEHQLRLTRDWKARQKGTCVDCGGETRYDGHGRRTAERCGRCGPAHSGRERVGKGPTQARVLAYLDEYGQARYSEIRAGVGIHYHSLSRVMHRLLKAGLIERPRRGVYRLTKGEGQ